MTTAPPSPPPAHAGWLVTVGRAVLFAGGVGLTAWLIYKAGPLLVLSALEQAGSWLPVIVLLEALIMVTDVLAVRALLGSGAATSVPARTWLRSATLAYASGIVLPAGRAAGEAIRAANLAPAVGIGHATGVCSRIQGSTLIGNALCSLVSGLLILRTNVPRILPYSLLGNAVLCSTIGAFVLVIAQSRRVAAWFRQRVPRLVDASPRPKEEIPARAVRFAVAFACLGRLVQTMQYAVVVEAVAGGTSFWKGMVAQGVHLVGATVGDFIPNQAGAMEGAYRFFLAELGLGNQPSRAVAMALIVRIAQLGLAGLSFAVGAAVVPARAATVTSGAL